MLKHPIKKTVTVNQFGAYGDGIHDDANIIRKAFNAGFPKVTFEKEYYLCDNPIAIMTNNVTVLGNSATLVMKDGYNYSVDGYRFMYIGGKEEKIQNIELCDLTITTGRAELPNNDAMQLYIENVDNVTVRNCNFVIKEIENDKSRHMTNIWISRNASRINIRDNKITNLSNSEVGGNVWISYGTIEDVKINNNYIEKSSHDESIAIWNGNISNINIDKNEIYVHEEKVENPSNVIFSFGGIHEEDKNTIRDIQFTNNTLNTGSQTTLFKTCMANAALIEANKITHNFIVGTSGEWNIFVNTNDLKVKNNIIEIYSDNTEARSFSLCSLGCTVEDNKITVHNKLKNFLTAITNLNFNNNEVKLMNEIQNFAFNVQGNFTNNTISMDKKGLNVFGYSEMDMSQNINISNNNFDLKHPTGTNADSSRFIELYLSKINNQELKIENNTIKSDLEGVSRLLMLNKCADSTNQTIILKNNTYTNFKKIVFSESMNYTVLYNDQPITTTQTWYSKVLD